MILLALLLNLAWAQSEPATCSQERLAELPEADARFAVAWVAPWRRHPHGHVSVVPTVELRSWLDAQNPRWTGRTLQWLGVRRRNSDPRRRFQVRILEVTRDELCRPMIGVEPGTDVNGVPACKPRLVGPERELDGCGRTRDRRTGEPGATRYVIDLSDARPRGYCVVPLQRYLDEVTAK